MNLKTKIYPEAAVWTVYEIAKCLLQEALLLLDNHNSDSGKPSNYEELLMGDIPNERLISHFSYKYLNKDFCQKYAEEFHEIIENTSEEDGRSDAIAELDNDFVINTLKVDLIKLESHIKAKYL